MNLSKRLMATGIGSLPLRDSQTALELVKSHFPDCPHWPQLPVYPEEYFITQFMNPLVELGLVVHPAGKNPRFTDDDPAFWELAAMFYDHFLQSEEGRQAGEFFALPEKAARGFHAFLKNLKETGAGRAQYLKGQMIGPVTAGFQIFDHEGRASFYNDQLRDIITKCLQMQAAWQTQQMAQFGLPAMIFVDDAFIYTFGHHEFLSLRREDIVTALSTLFAAIRRHGGIPGLHVCAQADWSLAFEAGVEVLSMDAYHNFTSLLAYIEQLDRFLASGGVMAWGLVPTSDSCLTETPETLVERFQGFVDTLAGKGLSRQSLLSSSIITPSCGTGALTPDLARRVYDLTVDVAELLQKQM